MNDLTTPVEGATAQDADEVRRNRDDHVYADHHDFSAPTIIRGTNKVFFQSAALKVVPSNQDGRHALAKLIDECNAIDLGLQIKRIASVAAIHIEHTTPNFVVFSIKEDTTGTLYVLEAPVAKDVLAFKRFSTMLSIPYNFSKKNPSFLNEINFEYYLKLFAADTKKPAPVDLVFDSQPLSIVIPPKSKPVTADGVLVEGGEQEGATTVNALRVVNILKVTTNRGMVVERDTEDKLIDPTVGTRLPLFSAILRNAVTEIESALPDANPVLQSYATGYDDNQGRHYARIIFDNPVFDIRVGDDKFQLGVALETDFLGNSKDFGQVNVSFMLFRQICANGLMAQWSDEDKQAMRKIFVAEELEKRGFTEPEEFYIENADYRSAASEAATRFHLIFDNSGINMPVTQANAGLDTSVFTLGLKFFMESRHFISSRLASLREEFGEVSEEEFIKATHELAKSLKIASPELIKFFLVEFVAGEVTGEQAFKTPMDVVNYMTYMARAYESTIMADLERKAILFATNLQAILKGEAEKKSVSVSRAYRQQLSGRLLGLDPSVEIVAPL